MQPEKVVIYDAFVERAILILQCLDEDLAKYPRINIPLSAQKDVGSDLVTKHYINYQNIVNKIFNKQGELIRNLKEKYGSNYKYDIRLLDKLLWIMGSFKVEFTLNKIQCKVWQI